LTLVKEPHPALRARAGQWVAKVRSDPLMANSAYIMLSTASMGVLGFLFWILNARLFSATQIGLATALISATSMISYLSLLGLNSTFVRVLPTSDDRDAEISTGLLFVAGGAVVVSIAYVAALPLLAPELAFVQSAPYAVSFVILTVASAINLVTDSIFIAYRSAKYNLLVDGVIQGSTKLALPLALVGLGAYGIFTASGLAAVLAVGFSVLFLVKNFGYRPRVALSRAAIRRVWSYSAANYFANVLNIVPILFLPLIVIDQRGAADAAYFFVAFQIANLLNSVSYAVSQSLFAEGSYGETPIGALALRSGLWQAVVMLPAAAALCVLAPVVLSLFGGGYRAHGVAALVVFAASAPGVAFNTWTTSLLRLTGQLKALIWSNLAYFVLICGLAVWWADLGLGWIAAAWLIGNLVSGVVGGIALLVGAARRPRLEVVGL